MPANHLKIAEQADPVWQAKVHLAAALRLAVRDELDEGIDNHFTMMVPGYTDRFMILPFGMHWSEARARDIAIFNEQGEVLEGTGRIERSALCIHAPVHRITGARVVLHTHQTWALALNMLKDNRLLPASQTAAFFASRWTSPLPMSVGPDIGLFTAVSPSSVMVRTGLLNAFTPGLPPQR